MNNVNPIYLLEFDESDFPYRLWITGGISGLVMRFFKLDSQLKIFLSEYPTPEALKEKLSTIMHRNPMARKLYTKLDGMDPTKYKWWVKIELLHSYNVWRILGNFLLGPISALKQGTDMVKNKYYTTAGDILNREINKDKDVSRMYYSPKNIVNVAKDKLNDESITHNIL